MKIQSRLTLRAIARLLAPWRTIRRLEAQNQLLSDAFANPTLTGLAIHQKEMTVGAAGPAAQILAGMFMGLLQDNPKAVNYMEMTFGSPVGNILVTVRRPGGATAHNLRAQAEQEARSLRAKLATAEQDAEYLRGDLATAREAVRRLVRWGLEGYDSEVLRGVYNWFLVNAMAGPLPPLPEFIVKREAKDPRAFLQP